MLIVLLSTLIGPTALTDRRTLASSTNDKFASVAFANISGTYEIPEAGFSIVLPPGWNGIDLKGTAIVSPRGINPTTGVLNPSSDFDKVFLILMIANSSKINNSSSAHTVVDHRNHVRDSAEQIGCKIEDKFVKLNGTTSEKLIGLCGPMLDTKVEAYAIASDKNVILVGLKGPIAAFDYNRPIFIQSVNSMKMENQTNIKSLISSSSVR